MLGLKKSQMYSTLDTELNNNYFNSSQLRIQQLKFKSIAIIYDYESC